MNRGPHNSRVHNAPPSPLAAPRPVTDWIGGEFGDPVGGWADSTLEPADGDWAATTAEAPAGMWHDSALDRGDIT